MTQKSPQTAPTCPSSEELSAYFDGENADAAVNRHISGCSLCQKKLQELRNLDQQIQQACTCTDEIVQRTLVRVRNRLKSLREEKAPKRLGIPFPLLIRAASFLILASAFVWLVWSENHSAEPQRTVRSEVAASAGIRTGLSPASGSGVDAAEFSLVSFGPASPVFTEKSSGKQTPVPIPEKIQHVWKNNFADAEKRLQTVLKKSGIVKFQLQKGKDGQWLVSFSAGKINCVQFTRLCAAEGFLLLSPTQPQPEQTQFLGKADELASYTGKFLNK